MCNSEGEEITRCKTFFVGKGDDYGCETVERQINKFVEGVTVISWKLSVGSFRPTGDDKKLGIRQRIFRLITGFSPLQEKRPLIAGARIRIWYKDLEPSSSSNFLIVFMGRSAKSMEMGDRRLSMPPPGKEKVRSVTKGVSYEATFGDIEELVLSSGDFTVEEYR